MAWYPLGHGDPAMQKETVFTDLAAKYQKTTAQVILRWHTQVGNIVIPGSKNVEHIKDNINIFDFTLTEEEIASINAINKNVPYYVSTKEALAGYLAFAPDFDGQE
jgi:diketogulonate reductase-like aldo/keto reductase